LAFAAYVQIEKFRKPNVTMVAFSQTDALRSQPSTKPNAVRMRRLLDRRRRGFRCLTIEYCDADVDGLVRSGLLDRQHRDDDAAVERAIVSMLERL
jgi:hypothetical protein